MSANSGCRKPCSFVIEVGKGLVPSLAGTAHDRSAEETDDIDGEDGAADPTGEDEQSGTHAQRGMLSCFEFPADIRHPHADHGRVTVGVHGTPLDERHVWASGSKLGSTPEVTARDAEP
ncbi:hypothetical protein ACFSUK_12785 [Sphingobium scionense]